MKKYVIISDFSLTARNRGTAALGYGSLSFLREKRLLQDFHEVATFSVRWNPFGNFFSQITRKTIVVQGAKVSFVHFVTNIFEYMLWKKFGISLPFRPFGQLVRNIACVAAINGGDGFSDIYGEKMYRSRLEEIKMAMKMNAPLILLPQTIGPFKNSKIFEDAKCILKYADKVYVRDKMFIPQLEQMGINFELVNDLSAYMEPEPWNIEIKPDSIGINVSGLAYSNKFLDLAGQFSCYPELMIKLVQYFQKKGKTIYLIPHAYGYDDPEWDNDDVVSGRDFFNSLQDKTNVVFIDKNLTSPQVKYVISKMTFFVGTRMHANFAAIFTKVPVFGLAYSFKFQGAFENNGIFNRTARIDNIAPADVDVIISQIGDAYEQDVVCR